MSKNTPSNRRARRIAVSALVSAIAAGALAGPLPEAFADTENASEREIWTVANLTREPVKITLKGDYQLDNKESLIAQIDAAGDLAPGDYVMLDIEWAAGPNTDPDGSIDYSIIGEDGPETIRDGRINEAPRDTKQNVDSKYQTLSYHDGGMNNESTIVMPTDEDEQSAANAAATNTGAVNDVSGDLAKLAAKAVLGQLGSSAGGIAATKVLGALAGALGFNIGSSQLADISAQLDAIKTELDDLSIEVKELAKEEDWNNFHRPDDNLNTTLGKIQTYMNRAVQITSGNQAGDATDTVNHLAEEIATAKSQLGEATAALRKALDGQEGVVDPSTYGAALQTYIDARMASITGALVAMASLNDQATAEGGAFNSFWTPAVKDVRIAQSSAYGISQIDDGVFDFDANDGVAIQRSVDTGVLGVKGDDKVFSGPSRSGGRDADADADQEWSPLYDKNDAAGWLQTISENYDPRDHIDPETKEPLTLQQFLLNESIPTYYVPDTDNNVTEVIYIDGNEVKTDPRWPINKAAFSAVDDRQNMGPAPAFELDDVALNAAGRQVNKDAEAVKGELWGVGAFALEGAGSPDIRIKAGKNPFAVNRIVNTETGEVVFDEDLGQVVLDPFESENDRVAFEVQRGYSIDGSFQVWAASQFTVDPTLTTNISFEVVPPNQQAQNDIES